MQPKRNIFALFHSDSKVLTQEDCKKNEHNRLFYFEKKTEKMKRDEWVGAACYNLYFLLVSAMVKVACVWVGMWARVTMSSFAI